MKKGNIKLLIALGLLGTGSALCEEKKQADDFSWMRGANYVPSYAKNDVATWMDFDPAVIDREMGYAQRLKLNTVRVFLSVQVYEKNPALFLERFEQFLALCAKHQIQLMPVLFDSCFDPQEVDITEYRDKNWIPSPGFHRLGEKDRPAMATYIKAIVSTYKTDKRIVLWDVMNEPEMTAEFRNSEGKARIIDFVRWAIAQIREEQPVQPLGVGWAYVSNIHLSSDVSDVLILHNYSNPQGLETGIMQLKEMGRSLNKPVILNEFVGRPRQPIEEALPRVTKANIGWCFWELMIGKTQFSQGRRPYQGHLYPDGTCYSAKEVAAILYPEGPSAAIAERAGFRVSERGLKPFKDEGISFSPHWERWQGKGPAKGRLWYASDTNETATKEVEGCRVILTLKFGPDCGMATVTVDGKPATLSSIDTYSSVVDWAKRVVVAENLAPGKHTVVVTATGRKSKPSTHNYVQIVDIEGESE